MSAPMTEAMGGGRVVPVPDPVARDYLLLALRLDQHVPGLVDAYIGPADLKAHVDMEQLRSPARLRADATDLRERVEREISEPARRRWLAAQLIALETHAAALAGDVLPYEAHVERCFDWRPRRRDEAVFAAAATRIDELLPGDGPLVERLAAWDRRFEIPAERLTAVADWVVGELRTRAARRYGLPAGESLTVSVVRGQPWTAYNWYVGGLRSRVDLNADLPMAAGALLRAAAHETFPGHHLEHAWKERTLVDDAGHLEASVQLINAPECLVSEGLADLGAARIAEGDDRADLVVELYERSGIAFDGRRVDARQRAELEVALEGPRRTLNASRVNAALMRHADGLSHDEVLAYLVDVGRFSPEVAAKRLEFIEHPLWRTYVFVYHEGEDLLADWVAAAPPDARDERLGRLLREPLTPGGLAADLAAQTG